MLYSGCFWPSCQLSDVTHVFPFLTISTVHINTGKPCRDFHLYILFCIPIRKKKSECIRPFFDQALEKVFAIIMYVTEFDDGNIHPCPRSLHVLYVFHLSGMACLSSVLFIAAPLCSSSVCFPPTRSLPFPTMLCEPHHQDGRRDGGI